MTVIVLMTAMPPTVGHKYLIDWACNYAKSIGTWVNLIVGTQPSEPMAKERYQALAAILPYGNNIYHQHEEIQQQPNGPDDFTFWDIWTDRLNRMLNGINPDDVFVSSEGYGAELAKRFGCKSVVCDPYRDVIKAKATNIRKSPYDYFGDILPTFQPYVRKTVTIFGAESTGKTTVTQALGRAEGYLGVHEWARPYLESLGSPEVTVEHMEEIVRGQYVTQQTAKLVAGNHFAIIQDTDLLSTIGYYRIFNPDYAKLNGYKQAVKLFEKSKSDLYVMLKSNIPFETDPLRYGGDVRQGSDEFWEDLLKEYGCNYQIIQSSRPHTRQYRIEQLIYDEFEKCPLWGFERKGNK